MRSKRKQVRRCAPRRARGPPRWGRSYSFDSPVESCCFWAPPSLIILSFPPPDLGGKNCHKSGVGFSVLFPVYDEVSVWTGLGRSPQAAAPGCRRGGGPGRRPPSPAPFALSVCQFFKRSLGRLDARGRVPGSSIARTLWDLHSLKRQLLGQGPWTDFRGIA